MSAPLFNLPKEIIFCERCVMSNQRPASVPEFKHTKNRDGATYLNIGADGICDACKHADNKNSIDWNQRQVELETLLDQHRKNNGEYDCLVPGSGGKDSAYQSHVLKYKYGMNPLTCTWPPILYTDYGYKNFKNWIEVGGFDNVTFKPNGKAMKTLTRLSILNLFHPFQTFILGQKNLAPKIAKNFGIDLIFYGENEAEYGNPIADNSQSLRDESYFTLKNLEDSYIAGIPYKELIENHGVTKSDLKVFLPLEASDYEGTNMEVHYLGYYLKWHPQEAYYYAVENTKFEARPFRTQGTYSKYSSIDDKIDDLHYYTTFIKFGLGRASYDASQEIRNNRVNRNEAQALVDKFDGEFPNNYFDEILDYLEISNSEFTDVQNQFRSPHLWEKAGDEWLLKNSVNGPKKFKR
jgi:N-acetyl sugar amidotransferase